MSTISIQLDEPNKRPLDIAISMETPLRENETIWVWDHYFSTVLNHLGDDDTAEALLTTLSKWSTMFAKNMRLSFEELSKNNLLIISDDIQLIAPLETYNEEVLVEATSLEGHWPNVHIKIGETISPQNLAASVLALAQFFLNTNPYFYRELPLHALAMRKFYQNELHYSDETSIQHAPAYAFDTALKFQQSLAQK